MKLTLTTIAIFLFSFGAGICTLFYDPCTEINQWWDLRMNLYSILFLFILLIIQIPAKRWELPHNKFVLGIGIGLSASDVLDRLYFNITEFTQSDVIMIAFTIFISYLEAYTNIFDALKYYAQKLCLKKPK